MRIFSILFMTAGLAACGGDSSTPAATTAPPAKEKPADAAKAASKVEPKAEAKAEEKAAFDADKTYSTICVTCHGAEGKGDGIAGAALTPKPANFTDPAFWETRDLAHIQKVIKEGGASVGKSPLMAPYGSQFKDEEIAQLAQHLQDKFKPK